MANKKTRLCFDPWEYLEFRVDGKISPCCMHPTFSHPFNGNLFEYRHIPEFRKLKEDLYAGNLNHYCSVCSIKESVDIDVFRTNLAQKFGNIENPLSPPTDMNLLRIDMTEKCNLRCTYCYQSQPTYRGSGNSSETGDYGGKEIAPEVLSGIIQAVDAYPHKIEEITVNGHGETTCFPEWNRYCDRLLDNGHRLSITSNFAKQFSCDEITTFSRFKTIAISIDTSQPDLLKQIRRKVDLGNILANIYRIRAHALSEGRIPPHFTFISGIYDKNVSGLPDFAWFAVACGITSVTFWKMVKYPDMADASNVYPLSSLEKEDMEAALEKIQKTREILETHHIPTVFAGDFVGELDKRKENFLKLKLTTAPLKDKTISTSLKIIPLYPDPAETVQIFVLLQFDEQYFSFRNNQLSPWEIGMEVLPYTVIHKEDQELRIEIPIDDSIGIIKTKNAYLHVGYGDGILDAIHHSQYITCDLPAI